MPMQLNHRGKGSEGAVDAQGRQRVEGIKGTPSFAEPRRAKAEAAQLTWEDNGDGSWSIVVGNAGLKVAGTAFGVFWQDDDGEHYTAVTIEKA